MNKIIFGKDKSAYIRGIAIILMVANHTMPGVLMPFAVPLFSFLAGYGYAFAREKTLRHGIQRIWHLLSSFWFVLFAICLPSALYCAPQKLHVADIALCMFGLNPILNFFCWYVYFYIFAMLVMPPLSRTIDRYGIRAILAVCLVCGITNVIIYSFEGYDKILPVNVAYRCLRYLPIVVTGYWISSNHFFERFSYRRKWWIGVAALAAMAGIYFLRYIPYARTFDLIWTALFAAACSVAFDIIRFRPVTAILSELGAKSMYIWFLHALFFTHVTRGIFKPAIKWIPTLEWRIPAILILSYLMAVAVNFAFNRLKTIPLRDLFNRVSLTFRP